MTLVCFALLLVLALLGLPLFLVILGSTLVGQHAVGLRAPVIFVEIFDKIVDNPIFLTIPLFAHAGFVLSHSRAPARLVELSRAALGWLPGGAAVVTIVACALFTAFTGASGVTIIALGGLLLPLLAREGYPEPFRLGLVTTGGSLGLLFPPSLPLIVYALIASSIAPVPVDTLFLAGVLPGVLLMAVLAGYGVWVSRGAPARERRTFEPRRVLRAALAARYELPIPFLLVGGIYGGFVTVPQAAALVAVYVSLVEVFVYRDVAVGSFLKVTVQSMVLVGGILTVVMGALALTNFLTDQEIPRKILAAMGEAFTGKVAFLFALNAFLLVVGCLMDIYSAILVVVPLVLPIALRFGIDPVHLGIVFLTNLEIGYSTPPVGINLFISSLRFRRPLVEVYRASVPFIACLLASLVAITYVPWLSLSLVRRAEGTGTAEVVWKRRDGLGGSSGRGAMRWSPRARDSAVEWNAVAAPDAAAAADAREDLVLVYRPLDPADLDAIRAGTRAVRCSFELGRPSGEGWRLAARWEAEVARLGDLAGLTKEPEGFSARPASPPFPAIDLRAENWSAGRLEIEGAGDGRVRGTLRGAAVWFPGEAGAPEQIFDVEVAFDCPAELDVIAFRPPGPGARSREIPDIRALARRREGGGLALVLERTRSRPFDLSTSWTVDSPSPDAMAGLETGLDRFRVGMEDLREDEFPGEGATVHLARLRIDSTAGGLLAGRVEAVLRGERETFDVEVRFTVPLRQIER